MKKKIGYRPLFFPWVIDILDFTDTQTADGNKLEISFKSFIQIHNHYLDLKKSQENLINIMNHGFNFDRYCSFADLDCTNNEICEKLYEAEFCSLVNIQKASGPGF